MTRTTTGVSRDREMIEVTYQSFPSNTYHWAYVCVHPANGNTGGARSSYRRQSNGAT